MDAAPLLDPKNDAVFKRLFAGAPHLLDFLDDANRAHFDEVCARLADSAVACRVDPGIVQVDLGMDGKPARHRMVQTWKNANTNHFEMFVTGPDGKETKTMTIVYTRRTGKAADASDKKKGVEKR